MLVKIEIDVCFKVHKIKSINIQPRLLSYYRASSKINSTFQNHGIPEEKINGMIQFRKAAFRSARGAKDEVLYWELDNVLTSSTPRCPNPEQEYVSIKPRTPHMTTDGFLSTETCNKLCRTTSRIKAIDITMSLPFSTPPSTATASLTPFKADIPTAKLVELETLIQLAKLAPQTYENSQTDRRYGVTTDWLVNMQDRWLRSYDW